MPVTFKIVINSYNCGNYIGKCLASLEAQTYPHYQACIIDDASDDPKMRPIIKSYGEKKGWITRFNDQNRKAVANIVTAIQTLKCEPEDVIVMLDGDDWFFSEYVLEKVAKVYETKDIWLTYGQYIHYGTGKLGCAFPPKDRWVKRGCYRKKRWLFSHLKTFKAHLWNRVKDKDLKTPNGEYWPAAYDLATMFPMMEMAGNRFHCMDEVLYVYNDQNPLCDFKTVSNVQLDCEKQIRALPSYPLVAI